MYKSVYLAENREKYSEGEKKLIHWLLHRLAGLVSGSRWKPSSRTEDEKTSFCKCVSVSDIGFAVYLLQYYSKKESGEAPNDGNNDGKKNRRKHSKYVLTLTRFSEYCRQIMEVVSATNEKNRDELDAWILALIKKEGKKDGTGEDHGEDEENGTAETDVDIYVGIGMSEQV